MSCQRRGFRSREARSGFTLVEILLALAVIALFATLLLPGISGIFRTIDNKEPDQILWDAITSARERALTANREVRLTVDADKHIISWGDNSETTTKAWPTEAKLEFLKPKEGNGGMVLIGGRLVETETITAVRFYADGTCDRFRAQIRIGNNAPQVIAVDPWTCAPMIPAEVKL